MEKRNVSGVSNLKWAVVQKGSDVALSLHQHPDSAERFLNTLHYKDDFEVVELLDPIGYKRY